MEMRDDDEEGFVFDGVVDPKENEPFDECPEFEDEDVSSSPRSLFFKVIMILISCDLLLFFLK